MPYSKPSKVGQILASVVLLVLVAGVTVGLIYIKGGKQAAADAAAKATPEFAAAVVSATVHLAPYTRISTAIGTARAIRSIMLRNELPGTVRTVQLETGSVVEKGDLLVELDDAVEQAQLAALDAEARLAETMLGRMERALEKQGASAADVDRARAQRDMAVANVARLSALIEQKHLRAPFRATVGLVDLHVGQYLEPGTQIASLQGIDDAIHIDFPVTQEVARALAVGGMIDVYVTAGGASAKAKITALDSSVNSNTRNTWIRAELRDHSPMPQPGASVRVSVPVSAERQVAMVPVSALRRGPEGSSVWVLQDAGGQMRAQPRRVVSGVTIGDEVVIESGLQVGETVAAEGSFKIKYPGMLVTLPQAAPPAPTPSEGEATGDSPSKGN